MSNPNKKPIVTTIREKCKTCYTCVRECPAKAISIISGQAEVIESRCIHCGNCVKVCSQNAKRVVSSIENVETILKSKNKTAIILAPSFPAEFHDLNYRIVVGIMRKLGFDYVNEVGFGADLVTRAYKNILEKNTSEPYIATSCPTVVAYVEKYYPNLIPKLLPVVSPMMATAKTLKKIHGEDLKVIFAGPCIAKKSEKDRIDLKGTVDEVLAFVELKELIEKRHFDTKNPDLSPFDPPFAAKGALFPISGGYLQTAGVHEDYIKENIITACGKMNFLEAIKEFEGGYLNARLLETLACEGCILGPAITNDTPMYKRRHLISKYVKKKMERFDNNLWEQEMAEFSELDLSCSFYADEQSISPPQEDSIKDILKNLGKFEKNDELNCGACGYESCREHAIAILKGFAENEMCLPYTIEKLRKTVTDLEKSYEELRNVKETLHHREKLASMGQLSAGVAHELNNPLGIILMFSHIILEEAECAQGTKDDLTVIVNQANRCKKIVSGLLNFSRQNKLVKTSVNLETLCRHCLDSVSIPDTIKINVTKKTENITADMDKDQISQVIINLISNSIDAIGEKKGKIGIVLGSDEHNVFLSIQDTGPGIPEKHLNKIFDPFFTTKQLGKGTGLGLSVSYGIVKMHMGAIEIDSNTDKISGKTGTSVKVTLPKN